MHWIKAWYGRLWAIVAATVGTVGADAIAADPDTEAWQRAEQAGTAQAYQEYLDAFPVGRYMAEAYRRLIQEQLEEEQGGEETGLGVGLY